LPRVVLGKAERGPSQVYGKGRREVAEVVNFWAQADFRGSMIDAREREVLGVWWSGKGCM